MTIFSDEIITELVNKLQKWEAGENLAKLYQVPLDEQLDKLKEKCGNDLKEMKWVDDLIKSKDNRFVKTLRLREEIQHVTFDTKLSKWIVEDWGGITTGKNKSLEKCIEDAEESAKSHEAQGYSTDQIFEFYRIASWSKHIAFRHPKHYAIYDARVIYSLNWLLFKAGSKKYFPFPSSRNSVMELLDYRILLYIHHYTKDGVMDLLKEDIKAREESHNAKSKVSGKLKGELFVEEKKAFSGYCNLLKQIADKLYPKDTAGLTKVEMMLFSLADKDIAPEVLSNFLKIPSQDNDSSSNSQNPIV